VNIESGELTFWFSGEDDYYILPNSGVYDILNNNKINKTHSVLK
jgi:hypothetical protein